MKLDQNCHEEQRLQKRNVEYLSLTYEGKYFLREIILNAVLRFFVRFCCQNKKEIIGTSITVWKFDNFPAFQILREINFCCVFHKNCMCKQV